MTKEESIKTQKKAIRKEIFSRRKQITHEELETFSQAITEKVAQLEAFQKSGHIYIYARSYYPVSHRESLEPGKRGGGSQSGGRGDGLL